MFYGDKDLPGGAIPYLLNVDEKNRALQHTVLHRYRDIFPGTLLTRAPPNWKLGDVHEAPLEKGTELVQKSIPT